MRKGGYVYILANDRLTVLYVGMTSDLGQRVVQHRSGRIKGFTCVQDDVRKRQNRPARKSSTA